MNLLWRFLYFLMISKFEKKLSLFDKNEITLRVYPTDIDLMMHVNNGRYLSFMDLGRLNLMVRSDAYAVMKAQKIYPVVASEMIRFKKSLRLFAKFKLSSQLLGWDDKFFYLSHQFKVNNKLYAVALVKTCFLNQQHQRVSIQSLLPLINHKNAPAHLPEWVRQWNEADQAFHDDDIHE